MQIVFLITHYTPDGATLRERVHSSLRGVQATAQTCVDRMVELDFLTPEEGAKAMEQARTIRPMELLARPFVIELSDDMAGHIAVKAFEVEG